MYASGVRIASSKNARLALENACQTHKIHAHLIEMPTMLIHVLSSPKL